MGTLGDSRSLPRPPAPPGGSHLPPPRQSTSCLCVWVPPSRCRPLPLPSLSHSQEGPCVGCSFAPRVSTAWCYLGGPGTAFREPRERVSSGQAAKAVGLLPERVVAPQAWPRRQGRPPLGSGWRLVAWAPSWRLGSEGLCFGALGTTYVTEERERRQTFPSPITHPREKAGKPTLWGPLTPKASVSLQCEGWSLARGCAGLLSGDSWENRAGVEIACLGRDRILKHPRVGERRGLCALRRESPASLAAGWCLWPRTRKRAGARVRSAWVRSGRGPPRGLPCGPKGLSSWSPRRRGAGPGSGLWVPAGGGGGPWRRRGGPTVAPGRPSGSQTPPRRLRAASGRPGRRVQRVW